jgi:hypothetical protein
VNGNTYEGQGTSKKQAKHVAAEAALRSCAEFKCAPEAQQAIHMPIKSAVTKPSADTQPALQLGDPNPIVFLHKRWRGTKYVCVSEHNEPDNRITMSVSINNGTFEGTGEFLHLKDERLL